MKGESWVKEGGTKRMSMRGRCNREVREKDRRINGGEKYKDRQGKNVDGCDAKKAEKEMCECRKGVRTKMMG